MISQPTIPQILAGIGLFTAGSLGLCTLLWLGKTIALRRGWIVKRTEPIPKWVEFDSALHQFVRSVVVALGIQRLVDWLASRLAR